MVTLGKIDTPAAAAPVIGLEHYISFRRQELHRIARGSIPALKGNTFRAAVDLQDQRIAGSLSVIRRISNHALYL